MTSCGLEPWIRFTSSCRMSPNSSNGYYRATRRRWYQFGLGDAFVLLTIVGVALGRCVRPYPALCIR